MQAKTQPSGYEDVGISAPQHNQPTSKGEYSYANPDVKRPIMISSGPLVIGPSVTERREDDSGVQDPVIEKEDGSYAVPDKVKAKKPSGEPEPQEAGSNAADRIEVGKDEYAVSAQRVPSSPLQRCSAEENPYAVTTKKPSSQPKDVHLLSITPERFTVNDSEYAVSSKQSVNSKRDHDRGSDVQPEQYRSGEDQYRVSGKSKSLSGHTKKAEDSSVKT